MTVCIILFIVGVVAFFGAAMGQLPAALGAAGMFLAAVALLAMPLVWLFSGISFSGTGS